MDLDLFCGKVKFCNLGFSKEKSYNSGFDRCDLIHVVGRCRQLIEYMKVCEYGRSMSNLVT